ncbi:hypothetical protein VMCG_09051 [Cytospora schulzeri]|uniref:Uncharacterized protein n=1 Tax=Cytospora schulzeri TaxID=448051 RepID=A0A423VP09_9PEZI|nr:hypothetical protein VMCG_09051 [Valsa malicola]
MSFYSYSSTSYSSSRTHNGQTSGHSYSEEQRSDPRGTAVRTTTQNNPKEPVLQELRYFDAGGREVPADMAARRGLQPSATQSTDNSRRIEDVSDSSYHPQAVDRLMSEREADRMYRELMEDEYAKREGGA